MQNNPYDSNTYDQSWDTPPQNSLGKGILGAVIGSLPGIILWIIIGYFGWTVGYVGLLIAIGIVYGYNKLGGPAGNVGVVACMAVLLVAIYLGVHLTWSFCLYDMRPNLGLFTCVFSLFDYIVDMGSFYGTLGIGYLFGILGAAGVLKKLR